MRKLYILLTLILLPFAANAQHLVDGLYYRFERGIEAYVTSIAESNTRDVVIPESVEFEGTIYYVTKIDDYAFKNRVALTSVEIPNSVTSIGQEAFYGCSNLLSITIGANVTRIGSIAFEETGWYNDQPDGILYLDRCVLGYKGEKPSGELIIPEGTRLVADYAFGGCKELASVILPDGITSIGKGAFVSSGLTTLLLPNSMQNIEEGAFSGCYSLTNLTIQDSEIKIGDSAFRYCEALLSISIGNNATAVGVNAFNDTGWYNNQPDGMLYLDQCLIGYKGDKPTGDVVIAEGTRLLADRAFISCSDITSVTIPNSMIIIGEMSFYDCKSLTNIIVPNSVKSIGDSAFLGCISLTSAIIGDGVTSIGDNTFYGCVSLSSVIIGNSVTSIGYYAFIFCSSLTEITIPNSTRYIIMAAFMECSNLRNVFIGDGMERIGINAFLGCTSIAKIVCKAVTPPTCDTWALGDINKKTCSLVVPKGSKLSYQNANQWKDFFHIEEEGSTDDIKDVCINNSIIRSYGNVLRVSDAPTGSQINVYDLSGQLVGSAMAEDVITYVRTSLHKGNIGVVKIGHDSAKIHIR